MYKVYILFSQKVNQFYVGYTNDLQRRLTEHNRKKGKFTDRGIPWVLVHTEEFQTKQEAMRREKYIKAQKSRSYILSLVSSVG